MNGMLALLVLTHVATTPAAAVMAPPDARTLPQLVDAAADRYALSRWSLRTLAACESSWRPWVVSAAGDEGLMQFKPRTFDAARQVAGLDADASPFEPWQASLSAAAWIAAGHAHDWPNCGRKARFF